MITEEKVVQILKEFEQQDYKRGGVSIDPSNYNAIARTVVKNCSIPVVVEPEEMFQNMQYYMEHCQQEGYITPQDWLEKEKHF